jgi:putative transposase
VILQKTYQSRTEGVIITMTANPHSIDLSSFMSEHLERAEPDVLRSLLRTFVQALMGAEADALCGAPYGTRSAERTNSRNGYRSRDWDTRAGTIEVAIPKLRAGSYFPDWLLERRRRAERALVTVVATCYLLGVSTRRMERLVETLGITALSKSQVSVMAKELDDLVESFRNRPLDAGPYTFVAADALTQKVREGGRVVNVHALIATGVNADGHREILGLEVTTSEDGAGWLGFFRGLTARGLTGVALVTSDAHAGLVDAIAATVPGASWQRCRTHYAMNLMSITPKTSWGWVKAMLHSIYDQPDAASVHAQFTGSSTPSSRNSRRSRRTSRRPGVTSSRSPRSRKRSGAKSGPTTPTNASTARSAAAPTWSASSPTATPSSAWSAPSSPNNTTNGSKHGATSASTSWPAHAPSQSLTPPCPPPPQKARP